jgi:hypothetical protein
LPRGPLQRAQGRVEERREQGDRRRDCGAEPLSGRGHALLLGLAHLVGDVAVHAGEGLLER